MTREYRCLACGHEWETNGDDYPEDECPKCWSKDIEEV